MHEEGRCSIIFWVISLFGTEFTLDKQTASSLQQQKQTSSTPKKDFKRMTKEFLKKDGTYLSSSNHSTITSNQSRVDFFHQPGVEVVKEREGGGIGRKPTTDDDAIKDYIISQQPFTAMKKTGGVALLKKTDKPIYKTFDTMVLKQSNKTTKPEKDIAAPKEPVGTKKVLNVLANLVKNTSIEDVDDPKQPIQANEVAIVSKRPDCIKTLSKTGIVSKHVIKSSTDDAAVLKLDVKARQGNTSVSKQAADDAVVTRRNVKTILDDAGVSKQAAETIQDDAGVTKQDVATTKDYAAVSKQAVNTIKDDAVVSTQAVETIQDDAGVSVHTVVTFQGNANVLRQTTETDQETVGISRQAVETIQDNASAKQTVETIYEDVGGLIQTVQTIRYDPRISKHAVETTAHDAEVSWPTVKISANNAGASEQVIQSIQDNVGISNQAIEAQSDDAGVSTTLAEAVSQRSQTSVSKLHQQNIFRSSGYDKAVPEPGVFQQIIQTTALLEASSKDSFEITTLLQSKTSRDSMDAIGLLTHEGAEIFDESMQKNVHSNGYDYPDDQFKTSKLKINAVKLEETFAGVEAQHVDGSVSELKSYTNTTEKQDDSEKGEQNSIMKADIPDTRFPTIGKSSVKRPPHSKSLPITPYAETNTGCLPVKLSQQAQVDTNPNQCFGGEKCTRGKNSVVEMPQNSHFQELDHKLSAGKSNLRHLTNLDEFKTAGSIENIEAQRPMPDSRKSDFCRT